MKYILVLLPFLTVAFSAMAQQGIIRGSVIEDAIGEPIIGANILIEGLGTGTVTDLDGAFSFDIDPGTYSLRISYIGFQQLLIENVEVTANEVTLLPEIRLIEASEQLEEVVITSSAIRTTENALITIKRNAPAMLDGISSSRMQLTGDATAVEAAKRVTGVTVEGGKYVYVRGLGDRYSKTTLNRVDIPGLDPDMNTLQMDLFPTNLISNIVISKNFTAEMPADFTGGLLNVETKDFPEEKTFSISLSTAYTAGMNLNPDYRTYNGGKTDWLGYDDGTRALPEGARDENIPTPISGASDQEVNDFVRSFDPELGAKKKTAPVDFSIGISLGNQISLKSRNVEKDRKIGYIFSLSYRNDYKYYDNVVYSEYQRYQDPDVYDLRYAVVQNGQIGESSVLIGALGGLAYKSRHTKLRLTAMHLQNGENRAGQFNIDDNGEAVGRSGYIASSDNLEYNERRLTNLLLNGVHVSKNSSWTVDWRLSPTISASEDPDIRKTAFTETAVDTLFIAGAGGNPTRIWRMLDEINIVGKIDITKEHTLFGRDAKLKFGSSYVYKDREYEILTFDNQFFSSQSWPNPDPDVVLDPDNIFPNKPNSVYYQSGNNVPNPNAYESNVNNTAFYLSEEFSPFTQLKAIIGIRAEDYVQRHTGRDQLYANGDTVNGNNLDNSKVLDALDWFPSINLIYSLTAIQNIRASYSRTIARPSFKELSFAQILDPISNRIFNGSLFPYSDWDGNLTETRINNFDLRWEYFLESGQLFSVSLFYKSFDSPIELVRIPEQQTSTEFQPRNVGNGELYGFELEIRKNLDFIAPALSNFNFSGNFTWVESSIDMTETEYESRKSFERTGETIKNTREMAGQAPFVINAGLMYSDYESGWDFGLFYNVKGSTLQIVGVGLYPDIYYEPFHSLNLSVNKKIGAEQNSQIDFRVSNILNSKIQSVFKSYEAQDELFNYLEPGVKFSLAYRHNF